MAGPTQPANLVSDNRTSKLQKGKEIGSAREEEKTFKAANSPLEVHGAKVKKAAKSIKKKAVGRKKNEAEEAEEGKGAEETEAGKEESYVLLERTKKKRKQDERENDNVDTSEEAPKETIDDDRGLELSSRVELNHPVSQVIGDVKAKIKTRRNNKRDMVASTQPKGSTLEKGSSQPIHSNPRHSRQDLDHQTEQESERPNEKKPEPIGKGKSSEHQKGQNRKGKGGKKKGESDKPEKDQYWNYLPLYKAALSGDWDRAHKIIKQSGGSAILTARINWNWKTALHVAVGTGKAIDFVKELVGLMTADQLSETDRYDNNALHDAALVGNTEAAVLLVDKRPDLLYICSKRWKNFPVHWAAQNGHKETLRYLLDKTRHHLSTNQDKPSPFAGESGVQLLRHVIFSGFYGVALDLVHWYPNLATTKQSSKYSALGEIAKDVLAFRSGGRMTRMSFWQSFIYANVPVNFDDCKKHKRSDSENPAIENEHEGGDLENPPKCSHVTATTPEWTWARWAKETFSISGVSQKLRPMLSKALGLVVGVPCIKDIRHQKLKHKQALQLVKCLCQEVINMKADESESFARDPLLIAAELGIHEVVQEIVDFFPGLVWVPDKQNRNIFHLAVTQRHENVFNLLYQMSEHKQYITLIKYKGGNNILHLAAALAPPEKLSLVPGAALQMQRELQWFKAVEKLVNPACKDMRNKAKTGKQTPSELFTEVHKDLVIQGERWMKDTASACTIVATLIVTMVFAAAITVPGGNREESGLPTFSNKVWFDVFAIADTISVFTSTTSALLFLSILTSRYAESDFLSVLPRRLIFGLGTLFVSITMMMVAFGSAIYLVFCQQKQTWILIALGTLTCLPIASFLFLQLQQFPLLVALISSTCGSIFGKQSDRPFH